jgi:hypothetical protein
MFKSAATVIVALIVVVAVIIAGPLLTIWALNTLFPVLAIEYTITTWLAVLILGAVLSPSVRVKKS